MDELEAAKAFVLFLQSDALDEFRWDLDFRAAVQGLCARDTFCGSPVVDAARIADEMARVRAEWRRAGK